MGGELVGWLQQVGVDWLGDWGQHKAQTQPGIDMGDGRRLGADDVLEGHYRRMARHRQPTSKPATRQVAVQVGDGLMAAITVLAPDLVPLTEMAEQVSNAVPLVEPERQFRQNLHQALERTHRQHAAQRALGTRPMPQATRNWRGWMVAVGLLAAVVALVWGWRALQDEAPAA
jgi:hypothetical protein